MLQHDDSAFHFFALIFISIYIVPCKYSKERRSITADAPKLPAETDKVGPCLKKILLIPTKLYLTAA